MSFSTRVAAWCDWYWYQRRRWYHHLLLPFSALYRCVMTVRSFLYRVGIFDSYRASVPVIVVGNITVGGTGKTPFVMGLTQYLLAQGYRPGIVSRGYGSSVKETPVLLDSGSTPAQVGDETFMLYQRLGVPVSVCRRRALAIQQCEQAGCDVIISDDGLAHYAFERDIEIICVDEKRQCGSGYCLPAGPLREPRSRLKQSTLTVYTTGNKNTQSGNHSYIKPVCLVNVSCPEETRPLDYFKGASVRAMAGIGHPERFFALLKEMGYTALCQSFRDHHQYTKKDFVQVDLPTIMTEKDAVKCRDFKLENVWYLQVEADFDYARVARQLKR